MLGLMRSWRRTWQHATTSRNSAAVWTTLTSSWLHSVEQLLVRKRSRSSVQGTAYFCFVIFLSCLRYNGWPHHGRTFSIYLYPLSFWFTLPRGVLSTSMLYVVFLACMLLALFLALSLSPGNCLVSSWCDHSMLSQHLTVLFDSV